MEPVPGEHRSRQIFGAVSLFAKLSVNTEALTVIAISDALQRSTLSSRTPLSVKYAMFSNFAIL